MTSHEVAPLPYSSRLEWPKALLFAGGTLLLGMLSAAISFAHAGPRSVTMPALLLPFLWPPPWVFWAVWIVIYPCLGVAAFLIWRKRQQTDVRGALLLYALTVVGTFFFLPVSNLTPNNPGVWTLMDANGVVTTYALGWLYSRYEKATLWWLLPSLIWMPLTLGLKAWLWALNP
ncbi:tryptophan-rich sensory protein [Deinococcus sp.]|uniref:tryptophan-rich sensory protein n=1 Tax=Deinococcus sp. TaxID=47478 RepID=UPI003CC5D736